MLYPSGTLLPGGNPGVLAWRPSADQVVDAVARALRRAREVRAPLIRLTDRHPGA